MKMLISSLLFLTTILSTHAAIQTKSIEYTEGGVTLEGYLASTTRCRANGPGYWLCINGLA
jgi:hypothetical protein